MNTEPIFKTRKDVCVASDPIIPYGGWVGICITEKESKEITEKLAEANWKGFR